MKLTRQELAHVEALIARGEVSVIAQHSANKKSTSYDELLARRCAGLRKSSG